MIFVIFHCYWWCVLHYIPHVTSSPKSHVVRYKLVCRGWAASAVLDFAETLMGSPRVWQGRDKTTPKHYSPEDTLRLTHRQVSTRSKIIYLLKYLVFYLSILVSIFRFRNRCLYEYTMPSLRIFVIYTSTPHQIREDLFLITITQNQPFLIILF